MKPLFLLLLACLAASAETMTLTDKKGREIKASVIAVWPDGVTLKKADGTEHVVDFSTLSDASVEAIRKASIDASRKAEEASRPAGVSVSHLVTKLVGDKYRYFFMIRNNSPTPWTGKVEITLLNTQPGITNGVGKFESSKPMIQQGGSVVFFDAHTGPASVHGDWSVAGFSYVVKNQDDTEAPAIQGALGAKTEGF